jgi:hypothetical protein
MQQGNDTKHLDNLTAIPDEVACDIYGVVHSTVKPERDGKAGCA